MATEGGWRKGDASILEEGDKEREAEGEGQMTE